MPPTGIARSVLENGMAHVDKTNPEELLKFFESLELLIRSPPRKSRIITCSAIGLEEAFELFGFTNERREIGLIRGYNIPDMKTDPTQPIPPLSSTAQDVLTSLAKIWPQCNESNVRIFVSMLISFAVKQINQEIEEAHASNESHQISDKPQPHGVHKPDPTPSTPKNPKLPESSKNLGPSVFSGLSEFPVTLKAYTEASVSWDTITKEGERVTVKGFIDYGISYAAKTPEALETFFVIAETKSVGNMGSQASAQLLSYMGIIQNKRKAARKQNITVYGLLTDGQEYQFYRINNRLKVSRSKRFNLALDLDAIYRFLSQCLRSIIQSSPTSSPFRPIESHQRAAVYEESIEPQFIVDFEVVDAESDIEWPS